MPRNHLVSALAENLPFCDSSFSVVLSAQSFHWFDGKRALDEFARVLKPGGRLGLVWNRRDCRVRWIAELESLLDQVATCTPRRKSGTWRRAFLGSRFTSPECYSIPHNYVVTVDVLLTGIRSISFVSSMSRAQQRALYASIIDLVKNVRSGDGRVAVPHLTEVHISDLIS